MTGNDKFKVRVTRLEVPGFKIQFSRLNDGENWIDVAFATANPVWVTIPPAVPGQPERVNLRFILIKDSEPIGLSSPIIQVTANP